MPIHDVWARRTPYELFLPDRDSAEERFRAVESEAAERGSDLADPEQFVMLMAVGEALRELKGPDEDPARIRQHGSLLFHAFHFRRAGEPLFLLTAPAARWVVETRPGASPGGAPEPPEPAGYLQLPQHLFWSRTGEGQEGDAAPSTPESLDGVFWSAAGGRVSVLAALGLREGRPGFSVIGLPPVPLADAEAWMTTTAMRESGEDFRSDMPGAELESLYEVRTPGEILKLLARAWALVETGGTERRQPAPSGPPEPSGLAYHRILLE